jgi:outer membrane protein TolC
VRVAKREYIPDIEAFARYYYQENVPFLAPNFGTFGVHFGYNLFDGRKNGPHFGNVTQSWHKPKTIWLDSATKSKYECKPPITRWSALRQMVAVSREVLATRQEARRVSAQQLQQGTYLRSQADAAAAQELEAQTALLQSQLEYAQAQDELTDAIAQTAR